MRITGDIDCDRHAIVGHATADEGGVLDGAGRIELRDKGIVEAGERHDRTDTRKVEGQRVADYVSIAEAVDVDTDSAVGVAAAEIRRVDEGRPVGFQLGDIGIDITAPPSLIRMGGRKVLGNGEARHVDVTVTIDFHIQARVSTGATQKGREHECAAGGIQLGHPRIPHPAPHRLQGFKGRKVR